MTSKGKSPANTSGNNEVFFSKLRHFCIKKKSSDYNTLFLCYHSSNFYQYRYYKEIYCKKILNMYSFLP